MKTLSRLSLCSAAALVFLAISAHAQVFVTNSNGTISEYDSSGVLINPAFITGLGTSTPYGYPNQLAISGNTLFITSWYGTVSKYDWTTGAPIDRNYITGLHWDSITGTAFAGSTLYFSNWQGTIKTRDLTTGLVTNEALVSTGVIGSTCGLVISGNRLLVADDVNNRISEYDATTGAVINAAFISGLNQPFGITSAGSLLYVGNTGSGTISEYDITSGALVNADFITGLAAGAPGGIAVVPEPATYGALVAMAALGWVAIRRARARDQGLV